MSVSTVISGFQEYFGLAEQPFTLAPNTDFYVDLQSHQECYNVLMFALASHEGFIKVTGEVGTGKTLLSRRLLNSLNSDEYITVYIPNPTLAPQALWRIIAQELSVDVGRLVNHQVQERIQARLLEIARDNKNVVIVIDEAQCIPEDSLETLRLISNLETEKKTLIQIVLFGQPELDTLLAKNRFRQLRQRITYSASLKAMDSKSLEHYIQQRMVAAGYRGMPIFDDRALKLIAQATSGIPRLINIVAQKSLFSAFGGGAKQVSVDHVKAAIADTESTHGMPKRSHRYWRELLMACVLFALVAMYEFS